jgi:hypothetical protein
MIYLFKPTSPHALPYGLRVRVIRVTRGEALIKDLHGKILGHVPLEWLERLTR